MSTSVDFENVRQGFEERKQQSCFVRTLIVLNVFFVIIIALSITVIYRFPDLIQENKTTTNVCHTAGCVNAAASVLQLIDTSVEPCEDFYDFSCGRFLRETALTDEKIVVDAFSIVRDKVRTQLLPLINTPVEPNDLESIRMVKGLYSLCMNQTQIEAAGVNALREIHSKLGGWPCVEGDKWKSNSTWSWKNGTKDLLNAGFRHRYLFDMSIIPDLFNSSRNCIKFDKPSFGLEREFLLRGMNDSIVKAYYEYMVDIAVIFGADKERAKNELRDVLEFETSLADISMPTVRRAVMTLNETYHRFPYLNWTEYLNDLFPKNISISENERVIFNSLSYFEQLNALLELTSNRTIVNYLFWRITEHSVDYLNIDVRKRQLAYDIVAVGKNELSARWRECLSMTQNKLPTAVGALFIRNYFHPEAKHAAAQMAEQIVQEFKDILKQNQWMDETTKSAAQKKVDAIITHIGYPEELFDDKKLEAYYNRLQLNHTSFLASALNTNKFYMYHEFESLRKPVNKTDWISHSSSASTNAVYSVAKNSIELAAGILQGKFFSVDRPMYLNFGSIGSIIGHELTHGFDGRGRLFNSNGDFSNWWENATKVHFLQRTQCIIYQYGNFTEPTTNLTINGIRTRDENIADNGGIKFSYNAYKKWAKKHGAELRLPGLQQYSAEQMFWISAAQNLCVIDRTEIMRWLILTEVHTPPRYRVIGPMSNSLEFARDFKCKSGSPMNPVKKCSVW